METMNKDIEVGSIVRSKVTGIVYDVIRISKPGYYCTEHDGDNSCFFFFSNEIELVSTFEKKKDYENLRKAAYELYKQDWLCEHVSKERQLASIREYYEMDEEDRSAYEDYDDYLFENGYGGEMYVCFDEFLGAEFQDEGYMEYLLGPKLFKQYTELTEEVEKDEREEDV